MIKLLTSFLLVSFMAATPSHAGFFSFLKKKNSSSCSKPAIEKVIQMAGNSMGDNTPYKVTVRNISKVSSIENVKFTKNLKDPKTKATGWEFQGNRGGVQIMIYCMPAQTDNAK
jgi:hypothetical protein